MKILVMAFSLALLRGGVPAASAAPPDQASPPRLTGTFIQLLRTHGQWTDAQWDDLLATLKGIGIRDLIVQWSVLDGSAYYSSRTLQSVPSAPLERLLTGADRFGMRVFVGLAHDSDYWTNIQRGPEEVAAYLTKSRTLSASVANELAPIVKKHPSFQGWYIPEEIDDVNWRTLESRSALIQHLSTLGKELARLTPGAIISISTFCQAQSSPEAFSRFWDELFRQTPVNLVFFQDGVGVGKLELDEVPIYLGAIGGAAKSNGRSVQVVVEIFRQVSGPPIDNTEFRAVPGSLDRIRDQLAIAAQYSNGGIAAFSVPEYMTPAGGAAAADLLSQYKALIAHLPEK